MKNTPSLHTPEFSTTKICSPQECFIDAQEKLLSPKVVYILQLIVVICYYATLNSDSYQFDKRTIFSCIIYLNFLN